MQNPVGPNFHKISTPEVHEERFKLNDSRFESFASVILAPEKQDLGFLDKVKAFFLTLFSWKYVAVPESNVLININSLAKHTGLTHSEIRASANNGTLVELMEAKVASSNSLAMAKTGGTYDKAIACCDYAYSNPATGVFGVFDAAGHNDRTIHDEQVPLFENFFKELSRDVAGKQFDSVPEAKAFLMKHLRETATQFWPIVKKHLESGKKFAGPALCAGIVTTINGNPYFIGARSDDCSLCFRMKEGLITFYSKGDKKGLGFNASPDNPSGDLPSLIIIPLAPGSELFAFSDGIGEFVSKTEFQEVISKNKNRQMLLEDFHQAITEDLKAKDRSSLNGIVLTATGNTIPVKAHDGQDRSLHDDISIAYLKIPE